MADFLDLRTRAELLELCGDPEGAERLRDQSLEVAREVDITCYAYQLLWRGRIDEAIDLLEKNATVHPDSWNIQHSLGEAFEMLGDYHGAALHFRKAMSMTDDERLLRHIAMSMDRVAQFEVAAS